MEKGSRKKRKRETGKKKGTTKTEAEHGRDVGQVECFADVLHSVAELEVKGRERVAGMLLRIGLGRGVADVGS